MKYKLKPLQNRGEIIEFPISGDSVILQDIEAELFLKSYY